MSLGRTSAALRSRPLRRASARAAPQPSATSPHRGPPSQRQSRRHRARRHRTSRARRRASHRRTTVRSRTPSVALPRRMHPPPPIAVQEARQFVASSELMSGAATPAKCAAQPRVNATRAQQKLLASKSRRHRAQRGCMFSNHLGLSHLAWHSSKTRLGVATTAVHSSTLRAATPSSSLTTAGTTAASLRTLCAAEARRSGHTGAAPLVIPVGTRRVRVSSVKLAPRLRRHQPRPRPRQDRPRPRRDHRLRRHPRPCHHHRRLRRPHPRRRVTVRRGCARQRPLP